MAKRIFLSAIVAIAAILLVINLLNKSLVEGNTKSNSQLEISTVQNESVNTEEKSKNTVSQSAENTVKKIENKNNIIIAKCKGDLVSEIYDQLGQQFSEKQINEAWMNDKTDIARTALILTRSYGDNEFNPARIIDLRNEINSEREKKLLSHFVLMQCSVDDDSKECTYEQIQSALEQDYSNGAFWYIKAILEASNKDTDKTVEALKKIIASPTYDEYWGTSIDFYNDAYKQIGMSDKRLRVTAAIGIAAAVQLPPVGELISFCRKHSKNRADIAHLCIDVGKKMFDKGKTDITQALGQAFQKVSYEGMNLKEEVEKTELSRKKYFTNRMFPEHLLYYDEELFDYWYDSLLVYSEREVHTRFLDEVFRKLDDPEYDPCEVNGSFH